MHFWKIRAESILRWNFALSELRRVARSIDRGVLMVLSVLEPRKGNAVPTSHNIVRYFGSVLLALAAFALATALFPVTSAAQAKPVRATGHPGVSAAAPEPYVSQFDGGAVTVFVAYFLRTPTGAIQARSYVHSSDKCAFSFCTIQDSGDGFYKVFKLTPDFYVCSTLELHHFTGLWDAHNHTNSTRIEFLDNHFDVIGNYWPGRRDNVNWTPVYYLGFCPPPA
jgi:hypothetical protein